MQHTSLHDIIEKQSCKTNLLQRRHNNAKGLKAKRQTVYKNSKNHDKTKRICEKNPH